MAFRPALPLELQGAREPGLRDGSAALGSGLPRGQYGAFILAATAALLTSFAIASFADVGVGGTRFDAASLRLFVRSGARLSFVLFVLVFTASALATLWPARVTRWLLLHRRYFGFALAVSHGSVGLALATFILAYHSEFYEVTYGLQRIGGAFGYLALLVLVLTSFDGVARHLSPTAWRRTHTIGIWFLFINFMVSYGRRVLVWHDPFFVPFLALLCGAALLRLIARRRRIARVAFESLPAVVDSLPRSR
jgi:methionine sulfoxide reductase heme-binding subunit